MVLLEKIGGLQNQQDEDSLYKIAGFENFDPGTVVDLSWHVAVLCVLKDVLRLMKTTTCYYKTYFKSLFLLSF